MYSNQWCLIYLNLQNVGINKTVVGTKAADFNAKFEQLQGKNFLQAYSQLKGAGAISEKEGETATKAISDMQTSTSEKAFKEAGARLKTVIRSGVEREKQKAGNLPDQLSVGTKKGGYTYIGGDPANPKSWSK